MRWFGGWKRELWIILALLACVGLAPSQVAGQQIAKGKKPGDPLTLKIVGMPFEACWCPPGKFVMGSPAYVADRVDNEEQVFVTLSRGFWMGKYEVTQEQWDMLMRDIRNPSRYPGKKHPVESVSYGNATRFCETLTKVARDSNVVPKTGWEFRLPTEAQWEYACRAGTMWAYSFGDDPKQLGDYAWYGANSDGRTHPVGEKKPNAWGLYGMHGNVWEWCRDCYPFRLPGGKDPEVTKPKGSARVFRGGSWGDSARFSRSAYRLRYPPSYRYSYLGFRVALVQSGG